MISVFLEEAQMQLIKSGFGMAVLLGVSLAMLAIAAVAEDVVVLKTPRNAAEVIRGYGGPDGLAAPDIANYVALMRADARASALSPLIRADLVAGSGVNAEEAQVYQDSLSAKARARFWQQFESADLDLDGRMSGAEITAAGEMAAWNALDNADEAALIGLLALDSDGNGAVNLDELRSGLARAGAVAKPKSKDDDT
jgi:hypothetical protein